MIVKGKDIADRIFGQLREKTKQLISEDIFPTLAIVRMGERPDDIAYERSIEKNAEKANIRIEKNVVSIDATQDEILRLISDLNDNSEIHGILIFRPLPTHINEKLVVESVAPEKDVDGVTSESMALVYALSQNELFEKWNSKNQKGFAPCTAEAVVTILRELQVELSGKRVLVVGRSLVIGKPVSMLLLSANATITIAHTKTKNLAKLMKDSEIIVLCAGNARDGRQYRFGAENFSKDQIVIDCGISADANGLFGDADTDALDALGAIVTPVPGGVGNVTTAVLMKHVISAAAN